MLALLRRLLWLALPMLLVASVAAFDTISLLGPVAMVGVRVLRR